MIRTTETKTVEGIPFLMDIPWLGRLFSTHANTATQTELMLFITPHIISNTEDSNFITEQFQKKLGNLRNKPPKPRKANLHPKNRIPNNYRFKRLWTRIFSRLIYNSLT
ncbi:MAG: hypothetical protein V3R23_02100 [Nitrospinaceae bacterium]